MLNRASPPTCLWLERTGQAWARTCVQMCAHMCPSMSPLICPASPICPTCASHMPHMSHIASPHVPYVHSYVRSTCVLTYRATHMSHTGASGVQGKAPAATSKSKSRILQVPYLSVMSHGCPWQSGLPTRLPARLLARLLTRLLFQLRFGHQLRDVFAHVPIAS